MHLLFLKMRRARQEVDSNPCFCKIFYGLFFQVIPSRCCLKINILNLILRINPSARNHNALIITVLIQNYVPFRRPIFSIDLNFFINSFIVRCISQYFVEPTVHVRFSAQQPKNTAKRIYESQAGKYKKSMIAISY